VVRTDLKIGHYIWLERSGSRKLLGKGGSLPQRSGVCKEHARVDPS
jgi:hypothetical protein